MDRLISDLIPTALNWDARDWTRFRKECYNDYWEDRDKVVRKLVSEVDFKREKLYKMRQYNKKYYE